MTCEEFKPFIHDYAYGELEPPAVAAFDAHMRECPDCACELQQINAVDAALRRVAEAEPVDSAALDRRVREQIAAEIAAGASPSHAGPHRVSPIPRRGWIADAMGIAAAVALLIFAYEGLTPRGGVLAAAAQDHRREVVDGQWRPWLRDPAAIAALVAQNGLSAQSIASLAPAGYRLDRAKPCPLGGVPFVHLVFTNGLQEFSVYLHPGAAIPPSKLPAESANQPGIYAADFGADHVDCFQNRNLTAVVVSDGPRHSALSLAKFFRSSL